MRVIHAAAVAAVIGLSGCATQYGSSGLTGGYGESPVNGQLVKVNFYGNGYITADKVQAYALYRCAQVAQAAKKPWFVIYDSLHGAARDLPALQPTVGTLGGKPVAFAFMAMLDAPRPGAQEVSAVLAKLATEVQGGAMAPQQGAKP
jgi:hypothetical protein